ncbi:MAG: hypothetical protein AB7F43_14035 [Bacteriovoracia bacterium]
MRRHIWVIITLFLFFTTSLAANSRNHCSLLLQTGIAVLSLLSQGCTSEKRNLYSEMSDEKPWIYPAQELNILSGAHRIVTEQTQSSLFKVLITPGDNGEITQALFQIENDRFVLQANDVKNLGIFKKLRDGLIHIQALVVDEKRQVPVLLRVTFDVDKNVVELTTDYNFIAQLARDSSVRTVSRAGQAVLKSEVATRNAHDNEFRRPSFFFEQSNSFLSQDSIVPALLSYGIQGKWELGEVSERPEILIEQQENSVYQYPEFQLTIRWSPSHRTVFSMDNFSGFVDKPFYHFTAVGTDILVTSSGAVQLENRILKLKIQNGRIGGIVISKIKGFSYGENLRQNVFRSLIWLEGDKLVNNLRPIKKN